MSRNLIPSKAASRARPGRFVLICSGVMVLLWNCERQSRVLAISPIRMDNRFLFLFIAQLVFALSSWVQSVLPKELESSFRMEGPFAAVFAYSAPLVPGKPIAKVEFFNRKKTPWWPGILCEAALECGAWAWKGARLLRSKYRH